MQQQSYLTKQQDLLDLNQESERCSLSHCSQELADLRQENALTRQQLAEHLKRVEVWDARRWALVAVLMAALLSLASGLVVALARR